MDVTRNPYAEFDALLADLQNTVSPGGGSSSGYGSLNASRDGRQSGAESPASRVDSYGVRSGTYGKTQPTSGARTPGYGYGSGPGAGEKRTFNNNLSELDTLLQDLSNSRYGNISENGMNGTLNGSTYNGSGGLSPHSRPSSAQSTLNRRTVDSLLEELNPGEVIYAGPKKVTITVKETKTETGYPGETELISSHISTSTAPAASTATRELDDLMASLSGIKVNQGQPQHQTVTDSQYARPTKATQSHSAPKQNLDSMLGNLQADMSRQGVNTSQKGCCSACDKPIVGQVITALGKTWHPEHFTCAHCTQELGTRNFFERDGKPYCEPDYHNLFSPRCAYCNGPILDKCVTALEKTWHMEHFFCAQCGKQFGEEGFHEREGKPYCRDDYFDMFAPKCGACNRAIMENYISALNAQWHPDCFVCRDCRQPFIGGSFFDHEGQPYCETHYHLKRGSLCAGCHKPISGRCITAMFRKFHPEHFVCAFCLKQLNKGTFKEQNDKPYCHTCFDKLFG
ncbi:paxillin isoform X2 [Tribolium castaneum]|uniref:paxillin isoform X2 n=1 Tax=Tribolium castaneum TaxID=7070 RepID=UPI00046C23A6|nr:PREDICTED: paxillin isoform X3 [Tribolium castaneum]|eukprot:XP_008192951.1 PREDICTED: paxillin isoform X3 [Tribolium castaneum]